MLQNLGLTFYESKVYLALLSLKKASAWDISQTANVKRPTTYLALQSLKQKKLITVTKFREVKDYKINSIYSLKKYVTQQRKLMNINIAKLTKQYNKRKLKLHLRVYSDKSSLKTLLEKSLRQKSQLYIIGDEKLFKKELDLYWDFFLKRSQQISKRPKFKDCTHPVNLLIWDNKVVFVNFNDYFQLFGFKNKEVANVYKKIWKNF